VVLDVKKCFSVDIMNVSDFIHVDDLSLIIEYGDKDASVFEVDELALALN